jgi:hypothetical protein
LWYLYLIICLKDCKYCGQVRWNCASINWAPFLLMISKINGLPAKPVVYISGILDSSNEGKIMRLFFLIHILEWQIYPIMWTMWKFFLYSTVFRTLRALMMVYDSKNYRVSGILNARKQHFRNWICSCTLGGEGRHLLCGIP